MARRTMRKLLLALLLAGCGPVTGTNTLGATEQDARVSPVDAMRAYEIVRGIDYIPFGYHRDGCYARALYMSMELAAQRIPSSAQFLEGKLDPSPDIEWRYHVAPMLQVIGEDHRTIIDPSLAQAPVSLADWIALNNPDGATQQFFVPGSVYVGSIDLGSPASYNAPMIESFGQLPAFHENDIASACQTAWNYLALETPSGEAMRPKLVQRTQELLAGLSAVGKLPEYHDGDTVACGN